MVAKKKTAKKKVTKKKVTKRKATKKKKVAKRAVAEKAGLKVVYGVPWIEVEFGQRPEGWVLFLDKEQCIKDTKAASERGPYEGGGGYCGPERPLAYTEIPFDSLEEEYQERLEENGKTFTSNYWSPKFAGARHHID